MQKRALVTGGTGFLGCNLCLKLVSLGYTVTALDNLSTSNLFNLKVLNKLDNFKFIKHDVTNPIDLEVDLIFNLACPASPPRYQADPVHTTKTSVFGAINMLELARKNNAKILQASTSEVYGDPDVHPQVEEYRGNVNPIGIRACYDEGKRCAESLFFDYKRQYNVDIRVVRIFNTYGPFMDPLDGRVVSNFIVRALEGKSLEIYGDGTQTRSFCYSDDLINGIIVMMDSNVSGPINLGNPAEFTMLELAEMVLALTTSGSVIEFKPLPEDDPLRRKPDINLARKVLGWHPMVDLEEGLKKAIEYFSEVISCRNIEVLDEESFRSNSSL